jgi:hypothetical protein
VSLEFRIRRDPFAQCVQVLIYDREVPAAAKNIVMETVERGGYLEPTCRLSDDSAQKLLEELWACGFRPSDGTGNTGELAATRAHLADMRGVALKFVNVLASRPAQT